MDRTIKIGVSSCLLGNHVRYDINSISSLTLLNSNYVIRPRIDSGDFELYP